MADDQEKTEEPTSKKLEDARQKGNVPKSQDASGFVTLLVGIIALVLLLSFMGERLIKLYIYYQNLIGIELTKELFFKIVIHTMLQVILIILPVAVSIMIAGILSNVMQFGFLFTTEPLTPNFGKINPIKGLANLFSLKKLIDSIKIILKVSAVFGVAFYFFLQFVKELPHTIFFPMFNQLLWLKEKMLILAGVMLLLFLIIAIADIFIVRFQYFKGLRMSKQEVKDEFKQMEGDPRVKGRIRQLQMQAARKRMMQNIPTADVVITNPTHYAVALRYDKEKEKAPVVLAKGVDHLALRIRKLAAENGIQIVENPPLARELYKVCDVDSMIPANLFQAVAEVLSFVYMGNKAKFSSKLK
ncbi:flagellar biosynthesis protein FlhB [Campylobacter hyointestinalis subsp. hyointestinalis]|uniref:Flagellar biosynthetic protein FlhB n=1 Tax=Campylobacter hyointestinalis subsp. hyointestinalis TaxID=91352 RepID=A0A9W5F0R5_CAMHY|nr:flagellar biosynthesis protein FlhB [Campylobacter hyointestinalis]PPB58339.1 flagellar biosynthesis protein FlhB [Campylobacter hyointestinalis subsp. hyointestinalis]PPB66572.1 flagellar biosynthesis protein FlhB [Campylobacter hyointestinalis subsp. hyointestinalis]PPB68286.1 flagellar biosynthesis protein FlhB [Campylobacter hyointestinalis subsp. hyointestinalis]QCU00452.1 flagellar biosynthesis protein FlhB [Campylobacter hyointestinalis subsp. hyointestinalis]TWO22205.1 flagellar bio